MSFILFSQSLFMAFLIIFVAELGDKTQLIILTLAAKNKSPKKLAAGAACGFAIIVALGGGIAYFISKTIDFQWISFVSGIIFIFLGVFQLLLLVRNKRREKKVPPKQDHNESLNEHSTQEIADEKKYAKRASPFLAGLLAILSMEMGDKTQIMTIMLASTSASFFGTLIGAWMALSLLAVIGAFSGEWIAKKIPKDVIEGISAVIFVLIGILLLYPFLV